MPTLDPFNAAPKPGTGAPIPSVDIVAKVDGTFTVDPRSEVQEVHGDRGVQSNRLAFARVHGLRNSFGRPGLGR